LTTPSVIYTIKPLHLLTTIKGHFNMAENFTTPVGRLIGGNLYEPETTDYDGKPLLARDGVTPRVSYSAGIAIPKTPGCQHWANEPWGAGIWKYANEQFRNGETQRPDFSWKIQDGDSTIPNKRGKKNADREGYPGNWIIWFSGGYAPRIFNADGTQPILEKDAVKPGYYIKIAGNYSDNKPSQSPGLYMNLTFVALAGYGPEIQVGPDVGSVGFGQGVQLPPGASATPVGGFAPPPQPAPGPYAPPQPYNAPPPVQTPPPATVPTQPHTTILVPPPVQPVAVPPARQMTAKANGATYEQFIANGWDDARMIAEGYMSA
jgi:hypothetical protein